MVTTASRIFRPGAGATPPALAGREVQQRVLSRCLADLAGGAAPPHDVVLVGPRGNGKTALLNWFRGACGEASVDVVALTPQDIPNRAALVDALAPRRGMAKWLPRKVGVAGVASAEWQSATANKNLVQALLARCRRKPLAVLLDEAHTLALDVGGALLNASQQVRADAAFLLVLAGTPGLPDRLSAMDASFWSRLGEGLLGVGRLDDAASWEALAKPLAAQNVAIEPDALDALVEHSQRYPYFIQLWGDAIWQRYTAVPQGSINAALVAAAATSSVALRVADYYQSRYRELRAEGLLAAATALAEFLQTRTDPTATEWELDAALAAAGMKEEADRVAALDGLNRLGYVWCPPGQLPPVAWSAGIPSLTTYILESAGS